MLNWKTSVTSSSAELFWNDTKVCEVCLDTMEGKRAAARYCCGACKQAGYRNEKSAKAFRKALVTRRSAEGTLNDGHR